MTETLWCSRGKHDVPVGEFGRNKSAVARSGVNRWCLACWRTYRTLHGDAIPPEVIQRFMELQGGVCAICQQPERSTGGANGKAPRRLALDHDSSGAARGLLCFNCNKVLGHISDSLELLERIKLYLKGELLYENSP